MTSSRRVITFGADIVIPRPIRWRFFVSPSVKFLSSIGLLILGAHAVTACAPVAVGGVAAGAAMAASEERGLGGFVSDFEIQAQINKLWFDHSVDLLNRIDMTVDRGRVLLIGRARDATQRLDAARLAWQAKGVREVINEIQVDGTDGSLIDGAKDTWISTQIRGRITVESDVASQNYSVDTVGGVVYLMGVAKSPAELDLVLRHARSVVGVKRVVSHVEMASAGGSVSPSTTPPSAENAPSPITPAPVSPVVRAPS